MPTIVLNDGKVIPALGFGVFQVPADQASAVTLNALEVGYRSIDTAAVYGNETGVGDAIVRSGIPRENLYVTTKVWNAEQGFDTTMRAFDTSLSRLDLDYVDLYLIHWPMPSERLYVDTYRALQRIRSEGRAASIGVSNFTIDTLDVLFAETGEVPVVNQIELHPGFTQEKLRAYHTGKGIATEAWSPLGQGQVLDNPVIAKIAATHGKSAAQVVIRWHLQIGNIVIPKSVTPSRIADNFNVFDFALTADEINDIGHLHTDEGRIGPDPDSFPAR